MFLFSLIQVRISISVGASNESDDMGFFYCKNEGYVPTRIRMWSFGDGICDCCDGSDEIENKHVKCENTCNELENKRRKISNQLKSHFAKGMKQMKKLEEKGIKKRNEFKKEMKEIESEIRESQKIVEKLEKLKKIEDYYREKNIENNNTVDMNNTIPKVSEEPPINDENITDIEEEEENSDFGNRSEINETDLNNSKYDFEEEIKTDDYLDQNFIVKLWKYTFFISDEDLVKIYGYKNNERYNEKRHSELKSKIEKLEKRKRKLENQKEFINSDILPQFIPLFEKEFSDGNFKLKLFKEFNQDYTSLGKYKKMVNETIFMENGNYCWQTQSSRKSQIKFVCWSNNKLLNTFESAQCEYQSIFATPAICKEEDIINLDNKTVPELLEMKEQLGLE